MHTISPSLKSIQRSLKYLLMLLISASSMAFAVEGSMGPFTNKWSSDRESRFEHVIEGVPGKMTLTLNAKLLSGSNDTVAVYFADAKGNKKTGWRLFVVTSRAGESASKSFVLPKPKPAVPEKKTSAVKIIVAIENASKRLNAGEYTLTVSR